MSQNLHDKIKLIFYRLLGMEEGKERKELDEWLENFPSGQQLLREMSDGEAFEKRKLFIDGLQVEQEWQRVISSRRKHFLKNIYWRVAVISLPFMIGGSVLYWAGKKDPHPYIAKSQVIDVRPATRGAVLELSDGTLCELRETPQRINERNGKEIVEDSVLNYQVQTRPVKQQLIYNRLRVGRGHEYMLILSDGTKVWLNSDSELRYPVSFGKDMRRVSLSGEAYFEVAPDSTSPFIVQVDERFEVKVLGTRFNIKAYLTDIRYETTLVEGKVLVKQPEGMGVVLNPSEQIVIGRDGEHELREVDTDYYLAWHEGWFYFNDEPLEQVLEMFGRWYDVSFECSEDVLKKLRVTGKVKRFENLREILDMVAKIAGVDFQLEDKVVKVNKK